jgi:hypothetical protein
VALETRQRGCWAIWIAWNATISFSPSSSFIRLARLDEVHCAIEKMNATVATTTVKNSVVTSVS